MRHKHINGQLLNLDKTWKHLKLKQRNWICEQFKEEYIAYINHNGSHPDRVQCQEIVQSVYGKIQERGVWIPYSEVRKAFSSRLPMYRKMELSVLKEN